mmetsp:Transcript_99175/g.289417  ORF Transcript_99175/g.289417 Transcript_99175/m.289417 type:complete len:114 (+) Transcript_99175:241-582(+)
MELGSCVTQCNPAACTDAKAPLVAFTASGCGSKIFRCFKRLAAARGSGESVSLDVRRARFRFSEEGAAPDGGVEGAAEDDDEESPEDDVDDDESDEDEEEQLFLTFPSGEPDR